MTKKSKVPSDKGIPDASPVKSPREKATGHKDVDGIHIPKPMVDLAEDEDLDFPDDVEDAAEAVPTIAQRQPDSSRVVKQPKPVELAKSNKRALTPEQEEILKALHDDSMARVNLDDFLSSKDRDEFYVPDYLIPEGFSCEWKNTHVMGQPVDASYNARLQAGGWKPVPVALMPELVPVGYDRPYIERPGTILMIRPLELTLRVRAADDAKAREQMQDKMDQLYQTGDKQLDRTVTALNRSVEAYAPKAAGK